MGQVDLGSVVGPRGRGIASVMRTNGNGAPGTVDTYAISYTDGTTSSFEIKNGAGTNKNLLLNWDFRNPVNQKRAVSWNAGIGIDRWYCQNVTAGSITVNNKYLTVSGTQNDGLYTRLEENMLEPGKTYTASLLLTDGTILQASGVCPSKDDAATIIDINGKWKFAIIYSDSGWSVYLAVTYMGTAQVLNIAAVKLEIGVVSTLSNDPPANYAEQMLLCQSVSDDGKTYIRGFGSNKNLLHNWDFRNPVNQRAASNYSFTNNSYGYSLDRYVIFSGVSGTITLTKNTGYITLAAINTNGGMNQYLETVLRDGNYTFTVKLSNGIYYSKIFSVSGTTVTFVNGSTPTGLNLVLGYDGTQFFVQVYITAGYSFNLAAIKLELGSVSTLANDPPADYGEELRKCQRYYYAPTAGFDLIARTWTSTIALATVQFPSVMRVSPTIIIKTYGSLYDSSGQHSITNISSERFSGNYLRMQIKGTGLVSGQYPAILVDTELAFSADL